MGPGCFFFRGPPCVPPVDWHDVKVVSCTREMEGMTRKGSAFVFGFFFFFLVFCFMIFLDTTRKTTVFFSLHSFLCCARFSRVPIDIFYKTEQKVKNGKWGAGPGL